VKDARDSGHTFPYPSIGSNKAKIHASLDELHSNILYKNVQVGYEL
jgi:hypothetical protein